MRKKTIRCYKAFANVYSGVYNFPVYYIIYKGWSNFSLATCVNCGELFVINWENPKTKGLSINAIADSVCCPTCNSLLSETLRNYPQTIKLPTGKLGTFTPNNIIPTDEESLTLDFFELQPSNIE